MAELLNLSPEEAESTLTEMIVEGKIVAKVDRLTGIVVFVKNDLKRVDEHVLLNQWSSQIDSLLSLMVKTNHMISKEEMAQSLLK
jgi:26S proteasome regulatory subunit N5